MPVEYIPGDGTYYVWDFAGEIHKEKIGGVDPTKEPGYVRTTNSTSSSSSTNQTLQDPRALELQATQLEIERIKATNDYNVAIRNGDINQAQFAQTRLDNIAKQTRELQFSYAQLAQQASEGAANRGVTTSEGALNREQQAQLAAINNALSASQFGANFGLSVAEQKQKQQEAALAAANQFANLISTTDTAALPAFYKAGGGVIANALAGGNTALSDNALLPAARTLRAIANPVNYDAVQYNPFQYQPQQFAPARPASGSASVAAPVTTTPPAQEAPPMVTVNNGGPGVTMANTADNNATAAAARSLGIGFAYGTAMGPIMRYAGGGGDVPVGHATQFMAGDSTAPDPAAGGAHPENVRINDPTGDATFSVDPLTKPGVGDTEDDGDGSVGSLLIALGKFLDKQEPGPVMAPMQSMMGGMDDGMGQRYAYGTPDPSGIAPEDLTFLDQVRQLRQGVDTTPPIAGGYFNVGWNTLAPSLRASYAQSLQTRYGVPVADINAEANRFTIPGIDRGSFTSGYGGGAKQDI